MITSNDHHRMKNDANIWKLIRKRQKKRLSILFQAVGRMIVKVLHNKVFDIWHRVVLTPRVHGAIK